MKKLFSSLWSNWSELSLIVRIVIGLLIGLLLAICCPKLTFISIFGNIFVGALKAIAPLLVFFLVIDSLSKDQTHNTGKVKDTIFLYIASMLLAGGSAIAASLYFKPTLVLDKTAQDLTPPSNIFEVLNQLFIDVVKNPLDSLCTANYIGILFWAIIFGIFLRQANQTTKTVLSDVSKILSKAISKVIDFAPFGVMGLLFNAISQGGLQALLTYGKLLLVLVGVMVFVALVTNPLLVFIKLRRNPYKIVFTCLKESGITAFFTRSSAANIPVNMKVCENLNLDKSMYSVSIPLGATINMCGAAITITTMSLAAVNTLNIPVDISTAILMCLLATVSACGSSGVAGGSILLIPLACNLFGIPNDIAMQVVATGFLIGVVQDSCETALNSSSDLLFTITAEYAKIPREKAMM